MGIALANPERLAQQAMAAAWEPPAPIDYLDFAERNVIITEGSFQGPWNRRLFPYLDQILRALSPDDPCRFVSFMASAQSSKTTLATIFVIGSMAMGRGTFLYSHPTEDNARRWSKIKLAQQMRSTPEVMEKFPQRARYVADSVLFKERKDGAFVLLAAGANSPASLSQITVHLQVQDDLAKWATNASGDPESQADNRSRAVEFAKILKISTPALDPGCRISRNFEQGSQEMPYVPCPHCGEMQVLTWDNMLAALDPAKPEDACFTCTSCGAIIEEHHRPQMLAGFEWRAHNPDARRHHRSFWIWSAYSYLQSWERIAREWLKYSGEPTGERTFANDVAGKAYVVKGEARPWHELRDRGAESTYARGEVPPGALILCLGVDVQGDRVEWQLVGFGREYRRWVIDIGVIAGHISTEDTQRNLDILLVGKGANAAGIPVGIDTAAVDGNAYTEDVWSFARKHPANKLIMVRGRGDDGAPRLARVKRERNNKGLLLAHSRRFYNVGASSLKMALYRDLQNNDPNGRGFVFFPRGLEDEYYRQLTAERREPFKRHGFTEYRWTKDPAQANEALDTMIQATAAAIYRGVYGLSDVGWAKIEVERGLPPTPPAPGSPPVRRSVREMARVMNPK